MNEIGSYVFLFVVFIVVVQIAMLIIDLMFDFECYIYDRFIKFVKYIFKRN